MVDIILLIGLGSVFILLMLVQRKVGRIDRELWGFRQWLSDDLRAVARNEYRQVEALLSIYAAIRPFRGLPELREWAGSPDFLAKVAEVILVERPDVVVECSSGVSTLVVAAALKRNGKGRVISLEHEKIYADKTNLLLETQGLDAFATVVCTPLRRLEVRGEQWLWYGGVEAVPEKIDLLVVDGPPGSVGELARYPAGPVLVSRLRTGGIALVDDYARPDEQKMVDRWLREIEGLDVERLQSEKGLAKLVRGTP